MNPGAANQRLRDLLLQVQQGTVDVDRAMQALQPAADLGFAQVDHDRARRCGFPEVVYSPGKQPQDAALIAREILTRSERVLLTRATTAHHEAVQGLLADAVWHERARCITVDRAPLPRTGLVAIGAAGTSDLPVAEEAAVALELAGNAVERHYDVGVAGLHRLLDRLPAIRRANVAIAVAGMEGALASVLPGQLARPVIAVPTSVGYGACCGGLAALLGMMTGCAAGVGVVNIDNGFGAGYLASLINQLAAAGKSPP